MIAAQKTTGLNKVKVCSEGLEARPLRVLYINYLFDKKYSSVGAAVHVKEFMEAANRNGVQVRTYNSNKFSSEDQAVQSSSRAWLKSKLSPYVGQLNAVLSNLSSFRREWRAINEERPDALLVRYNLLNISAVLVAKLRKIPLVLEVNAPMALESRQYHGRGFRLPFIPEWFERLNLKLANRVYTVSEALKSYFVEHGIAADKISIIPNGVNTDRFTPTVDAGDVLAQHKIAGKVVIGFVGSFHYWHGVEYFEDYVKQLCSRYESVHFLFVGNGPLRARLEETFNEQGLSKRVTFAGYVEHERIPNYIAAMDIVVAPYPKMALFYFSPLKLFEYMAAGKAVVSSALGQIKDIVQDGRNGLLFTPGAANEFMLKTARLIEDPDRRAALGSEARALMCGAYSWDVNAQQVISLIRDVSNDPRNAAAVNGKACRKAEGRLMLLTDWVVKDGDWSFLRELKALGFQCQTVGVEITRLYGSNLKRAIYLWTGYFMIGLKGVVRKHDFDYVIAYQAVAGLFYSLLSFLSFGRKPKLILMTFIFKERSNRLYNALRYYFTKMTLSKVDRVICYSRQEAAHYGQLFGKAWRFAFIPFGVNVHRLNELAESERENGDYIFSAGSSNRDYHTLFSAVSGLPNRVVVFAKKFNVAGLTVPANVDIRYDVYGDEYYRYLLGAKIVVIPLDNPEISSGQMVLLESMGLGKPVITSKVWGVVDYVCDGENAVLVAPHDSTALATAIESLLKHPAQRELIARAAQVEVRNRFSVRHMVEHLSEML